MPPIQDTQCFSARDVVPIQMVISKPLGIKLTVDFAFKKTFGSPEYAAALIGLLNAILAPVDQITAVEIVNPFSYQEFADSKPIVLDVRCRDSMGRSLNVEMQVTVVAGLAERLVYYASSLCIDQLSKGDAYTQIAPSVSICLLKQLFFPDSQQAHHCFQLIDRESGRLLSRAIEVHTVELTKYNLEERNIHKAKPIEQWAFLLLNAQDYDAATLRELLPGIDFETAIEALEVISAKTEDKQVYDQREKAMRDYEWTIASAREEGVELGIEQGIQAGRAEGIQEGRAEGIRAGRAEGIQAGRAEGIQEGRIAGEQIGLLKGKILLLRELLGERAELQQDLSSANIETLTAMVIELQQKLRDRQAGR